MIGKLSYTSNDSYGKEYKEPLGYINLDLTDNAQSRETNAGKVDAFTRAVCALTLNTYKDAEVSYNYSVNEILA